MLIHGFQGTSLLDFPGRVASLLFTGGCNLRCPYCHNGPLVQAPGELPVFPEEELLFELKSRIPFIDGVVVSGGEPTLAPDILDFLEKLRALKLEIKLDTNGLKPDVLEEILHKKLMDFVALDLKTTPARYPELGGHPEDGERLQKSARLLLAHPETAHEFRTTCMPGLVELADIDQMGELLQGADLWILQQFAPAHAMSASCRELAPHPPERLKEFAACAEKYVGKVRLRGL